MYFACQLWEEKKIIINDLEKLRVSDFKEGNIINSAHVFCGENGSFSEERYTSLVKYAYDISNTALSDNEKLSSFLIRKVKEIKEGSLLALEIEPSYGAYIVAIGKNISEAR
ncbi:hypothetical protein I0E98_06655 [Pseudomonas lalucatii]|nr:hypothetical protein [Pseudomonas lalucatii]